MSNVLLVLCTCENHEQALDIASALVEARLAACVNILPPVFSIYRWQGKIERAEEVPLVIKTTEERFPALRDRIQQLHTYEVPEVIALPVSAGSEKYLDWVRQQVESQISSPEIMPVANLISEEAYLNSSYDPDREYVEGELLERNMGEPDHAGLQGLLIVWLSLHCEKLGMNVFPELRVQVAPRHYRVPDIAVTTHRIRGRFLREPPFLCVEVLSPEDRPSRMQVKIEEYLKFGVANVWLIDPRKRRAWSYTREGRREAPSVLSTDDPKIEMPIRELFSKLDDKVDLYAD